MIVLYWFFIISILCLPKILNRPGAMMRILVLGSGVIGVTSAWYLVQQGHEVTVIDRQEALLRKPVRLMPGRSRRDTRPHGERRVFH